MANEREKHYGTSYKIEAIPHQLLEVVIILRLQKRVNAFILGRRLFSSDIRQIINLSGANFPILAVSGRSQW